MNDREIQERAAYWLIEQEDQNFSAEQQLAFVAWLSEDERHRNTYIALERSWYETLVFRRRPTNPDRMQRRFAAQLMRARNLAVHDAERFTQGAFTVLRAAHHAPDFESEPWYALPNIVARNITQDWLCVNYDELLEHKCPHSVWKGNDIDVWVVAHIDHDHVYDLKQCATPYAAVLTIALEFKRILKTAVENLSTCTQQVYTLRKVHGLSEEEIAGELDLTPDTVNEHLDQAAYQCATHLVDALPPDRQNVLFSTLDACNRKRRALT